MRTTSNYLFMISHGDGMRYIKGGCDKLILANINAAAMAREMNRSKSKRAPKVTVTVLRKVSEYNG